MLNHIVIMGRLTRDPELRRTQSGVDVASFTLAVERDFSDRATGRKETDFIDCVGWRQTAEFVSKWFKKGQMMAVEGRLQSREYTDKAGAKRKAWEIQADRCFFAGDAKGDGGGRTLQARTAPEPQWGSADSAGELCSEAQAMPFGGFAPTETGGTADRPVYANYAPMPDDEDGGLPF